MCCQRHPLATGVVVPAAVIAIPDVTTTLACDVEQDNVAELEFQLPELECIVRARANNAVWLAVSTIVVAARPVGH
jgi:hypothetical protein